MDRDTFIKELHIIDKLLDKLIESTAQKIHENKEVRKLLNLPDTVHNKTKLSNYFRHGDKQKEA